MTDEPPANRRLIMVRLALALGIPRDAVSGFGEAGPDKPPTIEVDLHPWGGDHHIAWRERGKVRGSLTITPARGVIADGAHCSTWTPPITVDTPTIAESVTDAAARLVELIEARDLAAKITDELTAHGWNESVAAAAVRTVTSPDPYADAADDEHCRHGYPYPDCAVCHRTPGGAPNRDPGEEHYRARTEREAGPFAGIVARQAAKTRRSARVRHLHTDVHGVLTEALASADHRHELADADPNDGDSMYRFVSNVLLHAHDRARADIPDVRKGPLRVAVVAPMWVPTALPWFKREEVGRSPNFEWVPLWEDPCADVWHLIALAGVDENGAELAPSVLLDNYQWVGAYPAPTFHAGMGPHEPCGPTCTGNDHNRSENTDA